jgi:hypothetical protein
MERGTYPVIKANPRITRENLMTMRTLAAQEDSPRKMIATILNEVQSLLNSLWFFVPEKKNSMCKYYGHVIKGQWHGDHPNCADCGSRITSPSELRTADSRR